jgi:transcriptional regulator with XRE-family HTH domain
MFGRGASRSRTKIDSPLNRLRLTAGLSIPDLARRFGTTTATISRWVSGARGAPSDFVRALHAAALGNVAEVAKAQDEYRASLKRRHAHPRITVALPEGLDAVTAEKIVTDAFVQALAERGQR